MAILFNRDGSITFLSESGDGATQKIAAGTAEATWIPQYATFQAAHAAPTVAITPTVVILPQADPGVVGAIFVKNNTLFVSQGGSPAVQVGATGPTGSVISLG